MAQIEIKSLGFDDWGREVFTTKKGTLIVNVANEGIKLHTKCNNEWDGEPDTALKTDAFIIVDNFKED